MERSEAYKQNVKGAVLVFLMLAVTAIIVVKIFVGNFATAFSLIFGLYFMIKYHNEKYIKTKDNHYEK